jgi:hypothetical protein
MCYCLYTMNKVYISPVFNSALHIEGNLQLRICRGERSDYKNDHPNPLTEPPLALAKEAGGVTEPVWIVKKR